MAENKSHKKQILEKKLELRKQLWPTVTEEELWTHRRKDGFIPIPRVMPLVLQIMNDLSTHPVASTYLDLWCRKFEEQFVTLNKPAKEYAFYAGFSGQRGEQTWRQRVRLSYISFTRGWADGWRALLKNPCFAVLGANTPG